MRLVCSDDRGSQDKCRHRIGASLDQGNDRICMADKVAGAETCGTRHQGDEIALEADALYILLGRHRITGRPFLPCALLEEGFVSELLSTSRELADWQALFSDIILASEDAGSVSLNVAQLEQ